MEAPPGYRTQSPDTSFAAEQLAFDRWRAMSVAEKVELVRAQCAALHRMSLIGLRHYYPDADEEELLLLAAARRIGKDTVERLSGRSLPERP